MQEDLIFPTTRFFRRPVNKRTTHQRANPPVVEGALGARLRRVFLLSEVYPVQAAPPLPTTVSLRMWAIAEIGDVSPRIRCFGGALPVAGGLRNVTLSQNRAG